MARASPSTSAAIPSIFSVDFRLSGLMFSFVSVRTVALDAFQVHGVVPVPEPAGRDPASRAPWRVCDEVRYRAPKGRRRVSGPRASPLRGLCKAAKALAREQESTDLIEVAVV